MADDDVRELNNLLDQVKQKMIDMGQDPGTADALIQAARPNGATIVGNLADLQRMGAIAVTGTIPTPPGEEDEESSDVNDAFKEPPPAVPEEQENRGEVLEPTDQARPDTTPVSDSMTKSELLAEAGRRGVTADDSMTKQEIIDAINA